MTENSLLFLITLYFPHVLTGNSDNKDADTECHNLFRECLADKDFCDLALEYINDREITRDLRMKLTDGEYQELVKDYSTDTAFHDLLKLGKPSSDPNDLKLQYMNFRYDVDLNIKAQRLIRCKD